MLTPESHQMQMKLWAKLKQYREPYLEMPFIKFFIKRNQIYYLDASDVRPPVIIKDTVNEEAARFYNLS